MSNKNLKIFMVEDSETDIQLTKEALDELAFDVELQVIQDGQEAIRHLDSLNDDKQWPHIFLLDLNLPGKRGHDILSFIRKDERYATFPTMIMSTSSAPSDIEKSYDLGANAYIQKPIDLDDYMKKIKHVAEFWSETASLSRAKKQ